MPAFLKRIKFLSEEAGDKAVLRWMDEKGREEASLTSRQIWMRSGAVADKILQYVKPGDRVMIVYPFGLEFVIGLVACMRAGVIAVSVYPPSPGNFNKDIPKFCKYYDDCGATIALTTAKYYMLAKAYGMTTFLGGATWPKQMQWIATDFTCDASYTRTTPDCDRSPEDIAFIQYTSGSTGDPKGVMVSFRALDANLDATKAVCGIEQHKTTGVLWLPQYHDLGLVGGFLCTIYEGCTTYFFSPLHFISNPLLWAELIQRFRATNVAAPTFAYGLLAKRIRQSGKVFDLSSLTNAIISAEPIRVSVLNDMKSIGIPSAAIDQAYGAAESVAFILSGGQGLCNGIPSCGVLSQSVTWGKRAIVVDETLQRVEPEGVVGNVMITGPDLCSGYWNKPELNSQVFDLQVPGEQGRWYKTGDLGFITNDQLYLTGRKKDVVIIQGRNFYPQDLEWAAEEKCPGQLRPGCVAAGQYDEASAFIVGELYPGASPLTPEDLSRLSRAVYSEVHVPIKKVVVLKKNCLPKTTSGKIRRAATREIVVGEGFKAQDTVAEWTAVVEEVPAALEQPSIAVIGAGPAGMVTAYSLVKRGYTNVTVLEREPEVGGRSVGHAGYDEIYIGSGSYRAIAALAAEFGLSFPLAMAGQSTIPPPVAMPECDEAPERSLNDAMVLELWAKAGYGLADEDTPLHYVFGPFGDVCPKAGGVAMQDFFQFPPAFFRQLWGAMRASLAEQGVEFKLDCPVETLSETTVNGQFFDKVVVTVMPRDAWALTREPALQSLQTNRYGMVVFSASGLPLEEYTFMAPHNDAAFVGEPLEMYRKSGVWYALVYAQLAGKGAAVPEEELVANVRLQVGKLGGVWDELLAVKLWDFFPHARGEEINGGIFERWEAEMQGKDGVFWTGAWLGFDLTETVARHAKATVDAHFPSLVVEASLDSMYAPETMADRTHWLRRLQDDAYPLYPEGPTPLFPKHYQYKDREGVYRSGLWMMDVVGQFRAEPEEGIPAELLERGPTLAKAGAKHSVTARFFEGVAKPDFLPFKYAPTLQLVLDGSSFNLVGGMRFGYPGTCQMSYHVTRGPIDGEDRTEEILGPTFPMLRGEECSQQDFTHVFNCTYEGAGGGDIFKTETYFGVLRLVPTDKAAMPRARKDDFFEDSRALLAEQGGELEVLLEFGPWRECPLFVDEDLLDVFRAGEMDPARATTKRLGRISFAKQDTTSVDHDRGQGWDFKAGHRGEGLQWEHAFWPEEGCRDFYAAMQPLSTEEFAARSDGGIDVRNTLLAKVRQMVGSQDVQAASSPLQLGLNSFQLVQLAKYMQATYKTDFPVTLFFDLATLGDVIDYVKAQTSGATYAPDSLVKHCSLSRGEVVPLRRPDLWCFPPIIGSGVYRQLSRHLPADFEVCELMDLSFYTDGLEAETIQSLAQRYADAIRALQPRGPYALGGFSFGSILAHAVSHCLGSSVSCVIMLDGIAPSARSTDIKQFSDSHKVNSFIFRQLETGASYAATSSPAREVVLVVAEDQSFYDGTEVESKETLGWLPIEPDLIPHFVSGSHLTIMREPHVAAIAQIVLLHIRPVAPSPRRPSLATLSPTCGFERTLSAASQRRPSYAALTPSSASGLPSPSMSPSARYLQNQAFGNGFGRLGSAKSTLDEVPEDGETGGASSVPNRKASTLLSAVVRDEAAKAQAQAAKALRVAATASQLEVPAARAPASPSLTRSQQPERAPDSEEEGGVPQAWWPVAALVAALGVCAVCGLVGSRRIRS